MDQALRNEVRAFKTETEDRLDRLEKAVQALSAPVKVSADPTPETKPTASLDPKKP